MATIREIIDWMEPSEFWPNDKFTLYKDNKKEHRRKRVAPNWATVWASTEWYTNQTNCAKNAIRNWMNKKHEYTVED